MLEGSILHQLKVSHQPGQVGKRPLNFGVYYKNTLVALCHALEDCILQCSSPPLVITAFQRGKWYLQEADRYADLAAQSRHVVIMATPDAGFADHPTSQRANVHLVDLPAEDPVAQEWHLMILAPTYTAMVLCQELSPEDYGVQGIPTEDLERKFYGFWTFESNLVQETVELAIEHIRQYNPTLAEQLATQAQEIATTQTKASDDLGTVVTRVIQYLQSSEETLTNPTAAQISSNLHYDILDNNLVSNEVQACLRMAQLTDQADAINPSAAAEVAVLAEAIGQLLDLPVWQLHRLKLAGLLHRLAPLQKSEAVLTASTTRYTDAAEPTAPSCPLIPGAQVLRTMPRLRAIATIITHQTEHWDGSGQPAGLAGDAIPLESRILGLVEDFQRRLAQMRYAQAQQQSAGIPEPLSPAEMMTKALADCQQHQGDRWDPKLIDTLSLLVCGLQQGLNLSVNLPKISAGLWLIDSHCSDNLFSSP
ncbi:DICT sensory domain-containing protein [Pantanalinema sp. GBBB05]|uniref:DICT sensory domain-containing protein n=1 Tax=Pantanalinema sp. GBBB05 TaxID=2604139 RepID=UPI001DB04E6F|nr:metal-dependent phosphohydrolase [Pantanalinema sp. GBBB05]